MEAGGDKRTFTTGAAPANERQEHSEINNQLARPTIVQQNKSKQIARQTLETKC